jgi:hypothetical protein
MKFTWCCIGLPIPVANTFLRKVREAVPARTEHMAAFEEFNGALAETSTQEWSEIVKAWENNKSKPNPYQVELQSQSLICSNLRGLTTSIARHSYLRKPGPAGISRGGCSSNQERSSSLGS